MGDGRVTMQVQALVAPQTVSGFAAPLQARATAPVAAYVGDDLQIGSVSRQLKTSGGIMQSPWTRVAMDTASAAYTGIPMALGKTGFVAGGKTPWLSQAWAGVTAVTGTISLYNDIRAKEARPKWARGLVIAGGYMAATGSVIGALGGILPGACIAAIGSAIRAIGLIRYGIQDKRAA